MARRNINFMVRGRAAGSTNPHTIVDPMRPGALVRRNVRKQWTRPRVRMRSGGVGERAGEPQHAISSVPGDCVRGPRANAA